MLPVNENSLQKQNRFWKFLPRLAKKQPKLTKMKKIVKSPRWSTALTLRGLLFKRIRLSEQKKRTNDNINKSLIFSTFQRNHGGGALRQQRNKQQTGDHNTLSGSQRSSG
jgi:hypothetical protein